MKLTDTNMAFIALLIAGYSPEIVEFYGGYIKIISVRVATLGPGITVHFEFGEDELMLIEWQERGNHYKYFNNHFDTLLKCNHAPQVKDAIKVVLEELSLNEVK